MKKISKNENYQSVLMNKLDPISMLNKESLKASQLSNFIKSTKYG